MNYVKTIGGALVLIAVIGLEILFSAGIWYMVAVGMAPALGWLSGWLAGIVAPLIGLMALLMFVWGHRLKDIILEWEAVHGKQYDEDHEVYFNTLSYTGIVTGMKWLVLIADTAGILFRVSQESLPWHGYILLFIVFEALAISPWLVGTLVHIVSHRPVEAIRKDVSYARDVVDAQQAMKDIQESTRRKRIPPTARAGREMAAHTTNAPALESPKESALPKYQADMQSANLNQNGRQ